MKYPSESTDFLFRFFEYFLKLDREEEEQLMAEMKRTGEWEEIKELLIPYMEKGREEGIEETREEIALKLLEEGKKVNFVQKITELPEERIRELKEKDNREEEEQLMAEMKRASEWEEIKKLPISYVEMGREEGIEETREKIALKLLGEGMEVSFIQKITELSEERIKELMNNS